MQKKSAPLLPSTPHGPCVTYSGHSRAGAAAAGPTAPSPPPAVRRRRACAAAAAGAPPRASVVGRRGHRERACWTRPRCWVIGGGLRGFSDLVRATFPNGPVQGERVAHASVGICRGQRPGGGTGAEGAGPQRKMHAVGSGGFRGSEARVPHWPCAVRHVLHGSCTTATAAAM